MTKFQQMLQGGYSQKPRGAKNYQREVVAPPVPPKRRPWTRGIEFTQVSLKFKKDAFFKGLLMTS